MKLTLKFHSGNSKKGSVHARRRQRIAEERRLQQENGGVVSTYQDGQV
jgi:hypothetical protein